MRRPHLVGTYGERRGGHCASIASLVLDTPARHDLLADIRAYSLAMVRVPLTVQRGGVDQPQLRVDGKVRGLIDVAVYTRAAAG